MTQTETTKNLVVQLYSERQKGDSVRESEISREFS